jgi:DNA polymerase III epsilon subunit-like protein
MSLANLRSLLVVDTKLELPALVALSHSRNKNVTVFSLVTTTFMGDERFAILEVSMLHINPQGQIAWTTSLVNPEKGIAPATSQKTGLYATDVKDAPFWPNSWAEAFTHIASKHIVIGFNCVEVGCPAVQSQNERYSMPPVEFKDVIDVRSLWWTINHGKKSTLPDAAQHFSVYIDSSQRAQSDVITTARIIERMITMHGPEILEVPQRTWSALTGESTSYTAPEDASTYSRLAKSDFPADVLEKARGLAKLAVGQARSMREYVSILGRSHPVHINVSLNKVVGYTVEVDGYRIKGRQLGEQYTWSELVNIRCLDFDRLADVVYFKTNNTYPATPAPSGVSNNVP